MKIMESGESSENELHIFIRVEHENIVRYFDHFHKQINDNNNAFLVTEYCEVIREFIP